MTYFGTAWTISDSYTTAWLLRYSLDVLRLLIVKMGYFQYPQGPIILYVSTEVRSLGAC